MTYEVEISVESLEKHAQKFGTEGVAELAAEIGMSLPQVTRIIERCDLIQKVADSKKQFTTYKKPRKSAEDRAKKLLGLDEPEEDVATA